MDRLVVLVHNTSDLIFVGTPALARSYSRLPTVGMVDTIPVPVGCEDAVRRLVARMDRLRGRPGYRPEFCAETAEERMVLEHIRLLAIDNG